MKKRRIEALLIAIAILISFVPVFTNVSNAEVGGPKTENGITTFYYQGDENTERVYLTGSFNSWKSDKDELQRKADNVFTIDLPLKPGKYQYKFYVYKKGALEGSWSPDGGSLTNYTYVVPEEYVNKYTLRVKEVDKDGKSVSFLQEDVVDLTANNLNAEIEKAQNEFGKDYELVKSDFVDEKTYVIEFIKKVPEKTKYTLRVKEVDKDGESVSFLQEDVVDLTADKLNTEIEKAQNKYGKDYNLVKNDFVDEKTYVIEFIEKTPEKTKYTLRVKEVNEKGESVSFLQEDVVDLTAEELNKKIEKAQNEFGKDYELVKSDFVDKKTYIIEFIKKVPEKTKYTLRVKEVDKDGNSVSFLQEDVVDLTADKLNTEIEKAQNKFGKDYELVKSDFVDKKTYIIEFIKKVPEKTKYTLRVKEVDKDGNSVSFLQEDVVDLTAEELNKKIEKAQNKYGKDYNLVKNDFVDEKTYVIEFIEKTPEKTKYTLRVKEVNEKGESVSFLQEDVVDLTANNLNAEIEKAQNEFGKDYELVKSDFVDEKTYVIEFIKKVPEKTKYTLRVKEVDKDGNSIQFVEVFENVTVEEINTKTFEVIGSEYTIVGNEVSEDGKTITVVVTKIEKEPEQNKYTLRIKEVDKVGRSIQFLEVFENVTVEEINTKTFEVIGSEYTIVGNEVSEDGKTITVVVTKVEKEPEEPKEEVELTFILNGGTLYNESEVYTMKAKVGDVITLPSAPVKPGYKFMYWQGSRYDANAKYTVTGPHTFTAIFEKEDVTSIPWTELTPATPVEPKDNSIPWTELTPATPVEPKDNSIPWTELTPATPVEPKDNSIPWTELTPATPVETEDTKNPSTSDAGVMLSLSTLILSGAALLITKKRSK